MGLPDKAHWKDVQLTKEEETQLTEQARAAFGPFDFTADEEDDE